MSTLSTLTERVETLLMDSSNLIWDGAVITEAIRAALGEYTLAGNAAVTLNGLDGATTSTLPAAHDSLIVLGAAGYAAIARSIDRAESFQLGSESTVMRGWGEARLLEFKGMLGVVFPGYLTGPNRPAEDPDKIAAQIALLEAQAALAGAQAAEMDARADLAQAQAAAVTGQEARAAAAAEAAAAAAEAAGAQSEAARLRALRESEHAPWGTWD